METRHVETGGVRGGELGLDLVERQRRGVDHARTRRTMSEQGARDDRAGIEADRTAGDEVTPAQSDQVRRARSGTDEVHGHRAASVAASAQVAAPITSRGLTRRAEGPAAARAAASATEGTPVSASTRSERVVVRALAVLSSASGTSTTRTPSFSAATAIPASAPFACAV